MKINLIISFILTILNYNIFYQFFLIDNSIFLLLYQLVVYFTIMFFLVNLFSFSKILQKVWVTSLFIIAIFEIYFINHFGIQIDAQIIRNTLNTNIKETTELLNKNFIIYIILNIIIFFTAYKLYIQKIQKIKLKQYFIIFFATLIYYFGLTKIDTIKYMDFIQHRTPKIAPINFFPAIQRYFHTLSRHTKIVKQNISNKFQFNPVDKQPLITVMVIGESARADRFSINGYTKETTPYLEKNQNIISFTNTSSCDTSTISSVPCMMQRFTHKEFDFPIKETSFVQVFSDFGFDTYWITLQDEAPVIHTFCKEAKHCIDISKTKYDTKSLPTIKNIIDKTTKNTLIVIHTMGSHFNYNSRVEKKNQIFKPLEKDGIYKAGKKLDNSYDNTIYQTDIFLSTLFSMLQKKNAFVLYSSDHGESLGEKQYGIIRRYGHASPYDVAPKEQTNVPFIVWYSNTFLQSHNIKLKHNVTKDYISHDYIFSTILGCSGFKGIYIKNQYNLCSKYKGNL